MASNRHRQHEIRPQRGRALKLSRSRPTRRASSAPAAPDTSLDPQTWNTVRSTKVIRAKKLVRDPNYPPRRVLESVAKVISKNLKKDAGRIPD